MAGEPLRVISFNNFAPAYQLVAGWAARHGHRLLLVVTTPGPTTRRSDAYRQIVAQAPPDQDILVTTRLKRAASLIAALRPDLIVSATFPYRLPPEVVDIPRFGAINVHPTRLPAHRGPNPARAVYDGDPVLGATVHRIAPDFDTGPILSQAEAPLPDDVTPETIWPLWRDMLIRSLDEGALGALAGDPGRQQDETGASYAGPFTEADARLDWALPARTLQCRVTGLNLLGPPIARADIGGAERVVLRLTPLADEVAHAAPGAVLGVDGETVRVRAGDRAVQVELAPG